MGDPDPPIRTECLLVLDADPAARETLRAVLRAHGYAVAAAVEFAAASVPRQPYDVVIADVKRPDLAELTLAHAIKAVAPLTEVIVLTTHGSLPRAIEALRGTAFAYLERPVEIAHLLTTVASALERKRTVEALSRRARELTDLVEHAPVGLVSFGPDGRIHTANRAARNALGSAHDDCRSRLLGEIVDAETIQDLLDRLARGEVVRNQPARLRAADGSVTHVVLDATPHREAGRLVAARGVFREVPSRQQAEEIAWTLIGVAHELAGALDLATAIRQVVTAVVRLFDVRRAALYERDPAAGVLTCIATVGDGPDDDWTGRRLPALTGLAGLAVAGGAALWTADLLTDHRLTLPEWLVAQLWKEGLRAAAAVPLRDRGEVLGALTLADRPGRVFTDHDLRILAAFADQAARAIRNARLYDDLRRTRDFLGSITEQSGDAIVTTDARARLTYASPAVEEIFGYRPQDVRGRRVAEFFRTGSAEVRTMGRRLRGDRRLRHHETALRAQDGRWVPVLMSVSVLRDPDGFVRGTAAVITDMTEREAVEATRRELAELRAIRLLAASVAHEVSNPLTVVVGQLELLAMDLSRDTPGARRIAEALTAAEGIRAIVTGMTRITRIETTPADSTATPILDIRRSSDAR